ADAARRVLVDLAAGDGREVELASTGRHRQRQRLGFLVRHALEPDGHQPGRQLVVGDGSVGGAAHEKLNGVVSEDPAIALLSDHIDRGHGHRVKSCPMSLTLIALVVPLGLDTFAIAAALGMSGLTRRDRIRVTVLFTGFEMGMPIVGIVLGAVAGNVAGRAADYLAIVILIGLGAFMLWPRRDDRDEPERVGLLARTRGLAAIGLGISISLDELAIGFTLGLLRFPVVLVIALIGIQTLIVTQAGLRLGSRIGEAVRERAEQLAGIVLAALGVVLLVQRLLAGH